jgi:hypothetical protein
VCFFRRRRELLEQDRAKFTRLATKLAKQAHALADPAARGAKPVALVVDVTNNRQYNEAVNRIGDVLRASESFEKENLTAFEQDHLFLRKLEKYDVLISEIRPPFIAPDIFGLIHGRCLPTVSICRLQEGEDEEHAKKALRLSPNERTLKPSTSHKWPTLLGGYQVDSAMEPVIFWREPDELARKIGVRLRRIREDRRDLLTPQEAREYFLRIGRLEGKVFISNARQLNTFVDELIEFHQSWFTLSPACRKNPRMRSGRRRRRAKPRSIWARRSPTPVGTALRRCCLTLP